MKMTIVTDSNGNLVGAVQGHTLTQKHGDLEATVSFAGSHKLHKVEVEEELAHITDAVDFQQRLQRHIPKH
jgi:hypothetical protein